MITAIQARLIAARKSVRQSLEDDIDAQIVVLSRNGQTELKYYFDHAQRKFPIKHLSPQEIKILFKEIGDKLQVLGYRVYPWPNKLEIHWSEDEKVNRSSSPGRTDFY